MWLNIFSTASLTCCLKSYVALKDKKKQPHNWFYSIVYYKLKAISDIAVTF